MKIHKKLQKKSQTLLKVLPKTVLFRNVVLIFSLEKPCYLENSVVREPCKPRSACILKIITPNILQSSGMDLLEPYMNSGLGIALKASNGKYWTVGQLYLHLYRK